MPIRPVTDKEVVYYVAVSFTDGTPPAPVSPYFTKYTLALSFLMETTTQRERLANSYAVRSTPIHLPVVYDNVEDTIEDFSPIGKAMKELRTTFGADFDKYMSWALDKRERERKEYYGVSKSS